MNSYLHYLTSGPEADAVEKASQRSARRRAPHEPEMLAASVNSVIVSEDSDFIAENFPDGIPDEIGKNELSLKDTRIVALHCAGYKRSEIAELVGVTPQDVYIVLKHPSAKRAVEEFAEKLLKDTINTVKANYVTHANEAFRTTLTLMRHSKNDRVKLEAARDITKAAGVLDNTQSDGRTPIDADAAKTIANTLRELVSETREYKPLGNSGDLDSIKAELESAEMADIIIEETKLS